MVDFVFFFLLLFNCLFEYACTHISLADTGKVIGSMIKIKYYQRATSACNRHNDIFYILFSNIGHLVNIGMQIENKNQSQITTIN